MPGSCESDNNSSPSLISSLRNFRFATKQQQYKAPTAAKTEAKGVPASTNGRVSQNGQASARINTQSAPSTPSTPKSFQTYSPLSYRKYDASVSSQHILACIITKFQNSLKNPNKNALEVELKLTNEELSRVKELILQDSSVSENWKRLVSHEAQSFDSPCEKVLRINRTYLSLLAKHVKSEYNKNLAKNSVPQPESPEADKAVRTYARVSKPPVTASPAAAKADSPADLNPLPLGQTKVIMDEYEVFCSKEQNLRKLLDAFPGADIMEAQDILVKCDWNLKKAIVVAQNQPLKCSKKRALAAASSDGTFQGCSTDSQHSGSSRTSVDTPGGAEEIVLDSSDEEPIGPKTVNNRDNVEHNDRPSRAKRARLLSSSESEEESSSSTRSSTHGNSIPKPVQPQPAASKNKPIPSAIPNLPGLVITQVGNSQNSASENKKSESSASNSAKPDASSSKTESSNSNKAPQLVRLNSAVSIQPSSEQNSQISKIFNKTVSVMPVPKGIPKGVSITPVGDSKAQSSKSNGRGKRKKIELDDDEDEEYGEDFIFDSDESDYEEETLTNAHSAVLKFFEESTHEELSGVPGFSKKKVDILIGLRPFSNWHDLVLKLSSDKYLSTDLLNGAKKVLDMRTAINKLMTKCQQIAFDMEDLVENLKSNKESSTDYVSKQPDLLNDRMHLSSYQMLGLNWLLLLHNQEVNGILADEMGLGKTVQAIAFLAYLKEISISGPHLIVVPSTVLDNWKLELKTWWPDVSMIVYHGNQESRRELRMQILNDDVDEFDVMVTTYNMVTSSSEDRGFFKRLEFHYVVFDEAHMLKNMASQRYQHLMRIKAPRRLLLTGTPLQNNLVELMSLLIFAMPHMFSGKTEQIKLMFSTVSKADGNKNTYEKDRIDHAKRIMKPFVLRRLKKDVLKDLPEKHEQINMCPMTEDQAKKYKELVEKFSAEVSKNEEREVSSSGSGMMMQLRRGANHPLLLRTLYDDKKLEVMSKKILQEPTHCNSDPKLVFEDMSVMHDFELHRLCKNFKSLNKFVLSDDDILNSGKFKLLESMLPTLLEENHRVLLFSQFVMVLDIMEEFMNIKGYKFMRLDGSINVIERQQMIDEFNSDPSILVFLLSTKAGGVGINLTAADTVILHDIDFNPYNDKQAEDRCHRVGQIREVTVYRFVSKGTIEEGILQRAKEKLKLERDIHKEDSEENDVASVAKLLRDALGLKSNKS